MRKTLIRLIRKPLNRLGVDIVKYQRNPIPSLGFDMAFDVGANAGQYAQRLRAAGYRGGIVSFEPLSEAHAALRRAAAADPGWHVHDRCAIGDARGVTRINIAANSYSSSILNMLDAHVAAAPGSVYVGGEDVEVTPLSDVFARYRADGVRNFLKIDTQGFEDRVLAGVEDNLGAFVAVQAELSLTPLYEGAKDFAHFFDYFRARGFGLWHVEPAFTDPETGRALQVDAVFVNSKTAAI